MKHKNATELGVFMSATVAQLAKTLSKLDDPSLAGTRELVLDIQAQLKQGESEADKNAQMSNSMGQIKTATPSEPPTTTASTPCGRRWRNEGNA